MTFFIEVEQIILKFVWNYRRALIAKAILRKNNEAGGITLLGFRHVKETINQNMINGIGKNKTYRSSGTAEPEIKPMHLWSVNLQPKEARMGKDNLFSMWPSFSLFPALSVSSSLESCIRQLAF